MFATITSGILWGLRLKTIRIEVAICPGLPSFQIVGLPTNALAEARVRIQAALVRSGMTFPRKKVLVNLAPAELRKESSLLDLPIALAILGAMKPGLLETFENSVVFGELSLDGQIRGQSTILPLVFAARNSGFKTAFVPFSSASAAALIPGISVLGVQSIGTLLSHASGRNILSEVVPVSLDQSQTHQVDFAEVAGLETAKRGLMLSAAGRHHTIMSGPPGVGKSMIAQRFPTLLPSLDIEQALEVACLHTSDQQSTTRSPTSSEPPFRAPHYSITTSGLVGGGARPKVGEISLAHLGVLFLDEFLEFGSKQLEALRTPMQNRRVCLSRSGMQAEFPCNFLLIAAHNPCPCGYLGHPVVSCECAPSAINRYRSRLSGPMSDRFDIQLTISPDNQSVANTNTSSELMRQTVVSAVNFGRDCEKRGPRPLQTNAVRLLESIGRSMPYSMRRRQKLIRLATTVANLEHCETISSAHIEEALFYAPKPARHARFGGVA